MVGSRCTAILETKGLARFTSAWPMSGHMCACWDGVAYAHRRRWASVTSALPTPSQCGCNQVSDKCHACTSVSSLSGVSEFVCVCVSPRAGRNLSSSKGSTAGPPRKRCGSGAPAPVACRVRGRHMIQTTGRVCSIRGWNGQATAWRIQQARPHASPLRLCGLRQV